MGLQSHCRTPDESDPVLSRGTAARSPGLCQRCRPVPCGDAIARGQLSTGQSLGLFQRLFACLLQHLVDRVLSLLGTDWEPATEGTLLFIEDIGAKPYQVDRMLWQLRVAGKLAGVSGIVFGEVVDCVSPGAAPEMLDQAILSALADFDGPIAIGLRSGHASRQNVTLTFGVQAELKVGEETQLHLLEPAVTK